MNRVLSSGIFLLLLLTATASWSQPQTPSLGSLFSSPSQDLKKRRYFAECRQFYALFNDQPVWLAGDGTQRKQLAQQLDAAAESGLQREKYGAAYLSNDSSLQSRVSRSVDSLGVEIDITLAALAFVHDLVYGTGAPVAYQGVPAMNVTNRSAALLHEIVSDNALSRMQELLAPNTDEYRILKQQLSHYLAISTTPGFRDQQVGARKGIADHKQLEQRMVQLGFELSAGDTVQFNAAVKSMQSFYNIFPDGKVGAQTLKAINVPLAQRIRELSTGLNAIRWLYAGGQGNRIVINLPAAMLVVYKDNKLVLESKIIPGKPSTPTPQLSSIATEVVLYPYWHVPYSIATKELLPIIKRDPGFLDRGAYQVLNAAGKIVDPSSVNWSGLSTKYFPYTLRQSTGCDNALGWVKINFYNPFTVYLHDTPVKMLFALPKRFFSHGCMRVEKAVDLARLLLGNNTTLIDSLEKLGPLKNQAPTPVSITPMPVFVLYQPAWTDTAGQFHFYEDVYKLFGREERP